MRMRRTTTALLASLALLGAACGDDDETASTTTTIGDDVAYVTCSNPGDGYEIDYPETWETNPADVMEPCRLFDPEPVDVEPETQIPADIAVRLTIEPVDYETVTAEDPTGEDVSDREESEVAGRPATRIEAEATDDAALRPAGTRETRWMIDLGDGRTLVAATTESPEGDYEAEQAVLDEMVATLVLTGATDPTTTTTTTEPDDEGPDPVGSPDTEPVVTDDFPSPATDVAYLTEVRASPRDGFDRVVLQFEGDEAPSWRVAYTDPPVRAAGSGNEVPVEGSHVIEVTVAPASGVDLTGAEVEEIYDGPERIDVTGAHRVTEVVQTGDYEAHLGWAIGVDGEAPFGVTMLEDPLRLVIDVVDR